MSPRTPPVLLIPDSLPVTPHLVYPPPLPLPVTPHLCRYTSQVAITLQQMIHYPHPPDWSAAAIALNIVTVPLVVLLVFFEIGDVATFTPVHHTLAGLSVLLVQSFITQSAVIAFLSREVL